jgi:hypothetical protein
MLIHSVCLVFLLTRVDERREKEEDGGHPGGVV